MHSLMRRNLFSLRRMPARHIASNRQKLLLSTAALPESLTNDRSTDYPFDTLKVTQPEDYVLHVQLNRPDKRNAMNQTFWREMRECFNKIATDQDCRAVVLSGAGAVFSSGLDLMDCADLLMGQKAGDVSRRAFQLRDAIAQFQQSFTAIEKCAKPVIAAVHNACIGAAVDMICACDIRYCAQDAWFQIKEVDVGLAADVGTLQRMPKVIGNDSLVRELAYTSRKMHCDEAEKCGFISRRFPNKDSLINGALETASVIASKSPVAVQGTKINLVYSRDHSVEESLHYMSVWNQCMLQSEDLVKSATALMDKSSPVFSKL